MIERTISQSMYNARVQELEDVKEAIYKENIDNLTCRMTRKKDNGTWTEEDEKAYKEADKKCAELIAVEEAKLWNEGEKLIVVSDEEYEKLLEEQQKKEKNTPVTIPEVAEPKITEPKKVKKNGKEA